VEKRAHGLAKINMVNHGRTLCRRKKPGRDKFHKVEVRTLSTNNRGLKKDMRLSGKGDNGLIRLSCKCPVYGFLRPYRKAAEDWMVWWTKKK